MMVIAKEKQEVEIFLLTNLSDSPTKLSAISYKWSSIYG